MKLDLSGKRVLVLGLGMSGQSAALFCAARGAAVVAVDERPEEALGDLSPIMDVADVATGAAFPPADGFDVVVPSPGIPRERYPAGTRRVWGDIELAFRALEIPVVAITGTNGKSTTVRLVEAMLRATGLRARAAGNVGAPALDLVGQALDVAVLEVSSFQLETVDAFAPQVAVVLNVTPDHLDRHGDLEAYHAAKRRILTSQRADAVAVLNFDDPVVRSWADAAPAQVFPFATSAEGAAACLAHPRNAILDSGAIVLRDGYGTHRIGLDGLRLVGAHNLENTVAALATVVALGQDPSLAATALPHFAGLPHRCEVVAHHAGVTYVNDSKATNVGAAARSLRGFRVPILWIAGGRDKDLDFTPLAEAAAGRVRRALLIGETADRLAEVLSGKVPSEPASSLESAVARAARLAEPGDVVLLSPACASFDQFESFEARGECFRRAVARLVEPEETP